VDDAKGSFDVKTFFSRILLLLPVGVLLHLGLHLYYAEENLSDQLRLFSPGALLIAFVLGLLPWVFHTLRLKVWTAFIGARISFLQLFRVILANDFGRSVSPTMLGGGPAKAGMLMKNGVPAERAVVITFMGTVEDGIFITTVSLVLLPWLSTEHLSFITDRVSSVSVPVPYLAAPLLVGLGGLLLLLSPAVRRQVSHLPLMDRVRSFFERLWRSFHGVYRLIRRDGKRCLALTVFLTALDFLARYSIVYVLLLGLGVSVSFLQVLLMQWVVFAIMLLVPTPGATGGAEAIFLLVFGSVCASDLLALLTTGWRVFSFYAPLMTGLLLWWGLLATPYPDQ